MLKAVIFDLDGVVADSHPVHEAAWKSLLAEEGLAAESIDVKFLYAGHPRREILRHYLGALSAERFERLSARKDELYLQFVKDLAPKRGVTRVLDELKRDGIVCAVATSAGRARTEETLDQFGIARSFAAVVAGNDVNAAKPAPDIFLLAAAQIAAKPQECVVVEDSVAGVRAAKAAGMCCAGYAPREHHGELREAGADGLISEFPEDAAHYFRGLLASCLKSARTADAAAFLTGD